jgi:hypothetical protein
MSRESTILEKRIVAADDTGTEMAWFKRQYDADPGRKLPPEIKWEPQVIYANGKTEVPVWMPLPGSQYTFLECPIFEALYEGTRGPGKTLTLIMDFAKEVGKGHGKAWRGVLFRQKLGDLDDVVMKIEEWMYRLYPGFRFLKSKADYQAVPRARVPLDRLGRVDAVGERQGIQDDVLMLSSSEGGCALPRTGDNQPLWPWA